MDVFLPLQESHNVLVHCQKYGLGNLQDIWLLNQIWWNTRIELFKKNRTKLNGIPSCVSCLSLHPIYSFDLYLLPLHPLTKRKGDLLFFYQEFLQFHMLLLLHL